MNYVTLAKLERRVKGYEEQMKLAKKYRKNV